MKIVGVTGFVG